MTRLRGRASLMAVVSVSFILLVVIYHILSNEIDEMSSGKIGARVRTDDAYPPDELADGSQGAADGTPLFKGHKIVHLDLKGAPPKVSYYSYLFPLLRKLGATGVLMEYEDMFPFTEDIHAGNAYSKKDIAQIQNIAKNNQLTVIPLVQTFGHMEFVLKLDKYKDFREVPRYPQVLCPTYNKTLPLIYEMINQIVSVHPASKYLHIGADEVYQIGECSRCLDVMTKKQWGKRQLFLDHVSSVVKYIKDKYPELTVLMWDDEFRDISSQEIIDRGLHLTIEPVVWKYTTDPGTTLTDQLWESYAAVWKQIWVATAFKGATSPDRYYTDISYHVENHQRWLEIIQRYSSQITFKGVMLTGWQRYDHFSVLCELLPVGLPSLAINLAVLQASDLNSFPMELPAHISEALQCDGIISLSIPEPQYGWTKCSFHGVSVYAAILRLYSLTQEVMKMEQDNTYKGWLKPYNIKYSFASPSYVERAVTDLDRHKMEIMYIEKEMRTAMEDIYDNYTIEEWLETYIAPLNDKLNQLWETKEKLLEKNTWSRRPLIKIDL
ncbi:hexosaminidase D [Ooceraea biroi]|uniref:beta-N-acetylhexosaminidase n=1 Tax=Ooceraea biroi TaxID=2015173 RepID=A0A026VT35_OOCBI|nr:hexosaminidase D [Ooceraea biroi]EZA46621.1 Hexosaminidase D [Ooceraea biroi]